jgi:hypothetical protein
MIKTPKMRRIIWLVSVCLFWGCTKTPPKQTAIVAPRLTITYCQNERDLIRGNQSNWSVPVDSIATIVEYHKRGREEMRNALSQAKRSEGKKVYPSILIDSLEVGLMYLLPPSSAGYFGHARKQHIIYFGDEKGQRGNSCIHSVKNYFVNFDPADTTMRHGWFWLRGPMVKLILSEKDHFPDVRQVIRDIAAGYILGLRIHAKQIFKVELCELNAEQLEVLRQRYPLQIRLLRTNH